MCVLRFRQCPQKPKGLFFSTAAKLLRHQLIASTAVAESRAQYYS